MVAVTEQHDISYVPDDASPLHQFDLYVPLQPFSQDTRPPPLIVFIHGGAWRSEDKSDHAALARRLAALSAYPVAVPNYRLTASPAPVRHPAHAQDCLRFLHFLLSWPGSLTSPRPYDASRLYLLGHSCSAHILASIFLSPTAAPSPAPALAPSPALLAATCALVLSEGIYDLDLLLRSFPTYDAWFVAAAFGPRDSYASFDTTSYALRDGAAHIRWLILHSRGDTLVDRVQSERMYDHLCALLPEGTVQRDWDRLTEEHNELLKGDTYPDIVREFVVADVSAVDLWISMRRLLQ